MGCGGSKNSKSSALDDVSQPTPLVGIVPPTKTGKEQAAAAVAPEPAHVSSQNAAGRNEGFAKESSASASASASVSAEASGQGVKASAGAKKDGSALAGDASSTSANNAASKNAVGGTAGARGGQASAASAAAGASAGKEADDDIPAPPAEPDAVSLASERNDDEDAAIPDPPSPRSLTVTPDPEASVVESIPPLTEGNDSSAEQEMHMSSAPHKNKSKFVRYLTDDKGRAFELDALTEQKVLVRVSPSDDDEEMSHPAGTGGILGAPEPKVYSKIQRESLGGSGVPPPPPVAMAPAQFSKAKPPARPRGALVKSESASAAQFPSTNANPNGSPSANPRRPAKPASATASRSKSRPGERTHTSKPSSKKTSSRVKSTESLNHLSAPKKISSRSTSKHASADTHSSNYSDTSSTRSMSSYTGSETKGIAAKKGVPPIRLGMMVMVPPSPSRSSASKDSLPSSSAAAPRPGSPSLSHSSSMQSMLSDDSTTANTHAHTPKQLNTDGRVRVAMELLSNMQTTLEEEEAGDDVSTATGDSHSTKEHVISKPPVLVPALALPGRSRTHTPVGPSPSSMNRNGLQQSRQSSGMSVPDVDATPAERARRVQTLMNDMEQQLVVWGVILSDADAHTRASANNTGAGVPAHTGLHINVAGLNEYEDSPSGGSARSDVSDMYSVSSVSNSNSPRVRADVGPLSFAGLAH